MHIFWYCRLTYIFTKVVLVKIFGWKASGTIMRMMNFLNKSSCILWETHSRDKRIIPISGNSGSMLYCWLICSYYFYRSFEIFVAIFLLLMFEYFVYAKILWNKILLYENLWKKFIVNQLKITLNLIAVST